MAFNPINWLLGLFSLDIAIDLGTANTLVHVRGKGIGGAQRFIGSVLNMKPILAIQDGRVEGVERIRTKSKAHERVLELVVEKTKGKSPIRIATLHANAAEDAKALLARAQQQLNPIESIFTEVSPTVGTHAGPGTVGLAFMAGM